MKGFNPLSMIKFVKGEGFKIDSFADVTMLMYGSKLCHSWASENVTYDELVLAMYVHLSEPPLVYN